MVDDTELPFTMFVACAQLIVGIGLVIFATSAALRIIGGVIIAFALLTGGSASYHARRRGQRLFGWFETLADAEPTESAPEDEPSEPSSHGPRQPPKPEGRRSASGGPQLPGA